MGDKEKRNKEKKVKRKKENGGGEKEIKKVARGR